jgi:hypothetical protein
MIPGFEKLVEERIKHAQKRGDFDKLPGQGRPLQFREEPFVAEDLRLAHKILKNADCLPPELEAQREIRQTRQLLSKSTDLHTRYRALKKINFLVMKINTTANRSCDLEHPQHYFDTLVERVSVNPDPQ